MEQQRNNLRIYLIIASIVWFITIFPALFMAMFAPMLFDAPGSEDSNWTIAAAGGIVSYPLIAILAILLSWLFFVKKKHRVAFIVSLVPLVWIILNMFIWVAIEVFCDGSFSC